MQNIVLDSPYVHVPPRRGRFWPALLFLVVPRLLRKRYGVVSVEVRGVERLAASLRAGDGVLLASNHCRDEDPIVLATACRRAGTPCWFMASRHIFEQGVVMPFLLPRVGAFSVHREGTDRAAIQTAVSVLEEADRPLGMFPQGPLTRPNARRPPLQDGIALIARTAARRRAKREPAGRVVVHPVAVRYRIRGSADGAVDRLLGEIEHRLTWKPRTGRPPLVRILAVGAALLALKEIEILGAAREGDLSARLAGLVDALLAPLEREWCGGSRSGPTYERVKRLRTLILAGMIEGEVDEAERARRWKQLADIYLALQFAHYPGGYLGGCLYYTSPSPRDPTRDRMPSSA